MIRRRTRPSKPPAEGRDVAAAAPNQPVGKPERRAHRIATWWKQVTLPNKIAIVIPLAGAIIAGVFGLIPAVASRLTQDDPLALVDVTVQDLEHYWALVDVKVRSTADEPSFAKKAAIKIIDSRRIEYCHAPAPQKITETYDVDLPAELPEYPHTVSVDISQQIGPKEVDRFAFKLGTQGVGERELGATVYLFQLRIYYNEGGDTYLESSPLLAYVAYPWGAGASYSVRDERTASCLRRNANDLAVITRNTAYRSARLDNLVQEYQSIVSKLTP
jgi:hypothetical protein